MKVPSKESLPVSMRRYEYFMKPNVSPEHTGERVPSPAATGDKHKKGDGSGKTVVTGIARGAGA